MVTLTKLFEETQIQQFTIVFSKLKPGVKIKDNNNNILQIESIEDRKRLQIAKLKDIKTGDIIPASFSEIANLIINKDWKFVN
jgi:hypothetical protein